MLKPEMRLASSAAFVCQPGQSKSLPAEGRLRQVSANPRAVGRLKRLVCLLLMAVMHEAIAQEPAPAPTPSAPAVDKCWELIAAGQWGAARPRCEREVKLEKSYATTVKLGHTFLLAGDREAAFRWYRESVALLSDERELREGPLADFDVFIDKGWRSSDSKQARDWFDQSYVILRNAGAHEQRAEQLSAQGLFSQAEPIGRQALELREQVLGDSHELVGVSLIRLALLAGKLDRHEQELVLFQRALVIIERLNGPEHASTLTILKRIASLYRQTGRFEHSIRLHQKALGITERLYGLFHSETASSLRGFSSVLSELGRYDEAIQLRERALSITQKSLGDNQNLIALDLSSLAGWHHYMGRYGHSVRLHRQALAIAERALGPEHPLTTATLIGLGTTLIAIGAHDQALPIFQRTLEVGEKSGEFAHESIVISLDRLASVYLAKGDHKAAEQMLLRALATERASSKVEDISLGARLNNLALFYVAVEQFDKALPLYQRALQIVEALGSAEVKPALLVNLAMVFGHLGRYEEALPLLHRALAIILNDGRTSELWHVMDSLAQLHGCRCTAELPLFQPDLAVWYGKQAVNALQSLRTQMSDLGKDLQSGFVEKHKRTYDYLANLLISEGRIDEAQVVLQMLKEQELHEAFERSGKTDPRSTRVELTGLERKAYAEFYVLREQQAALGQERRKLEDKDKDGTLSAAERSRLKDIETKLVPQIQAGVERFMAQLQEQMHQQRKAGEKVRDLEAAETRLRAAVRDLAVKDPEAKAVALQFVATDDTVSVLLTTPGVPPIVRQVPVQRQALNKLVLEVRKRLECGGQAGGCDAGWGLLAPQLKQLHALLIAPIEADLKAVGARTLMLSPTGVLRYVPFAALMSGERYLVQDYTLAMFTEGVASQGFEATAKREWRVAGMGLTQEVKGINSVLSALPNVRDELSSVLRQPRISGQAWLDAEFDRSRLRTALRSNFNVLHVASHFEFLSGRPDASSLYLGDKSALTLAEVARQDIRFDNFDLVNFSACQTGVGGGKDENGQELESLGAKVLQQGAGAVMATLWKVADESTPRLMQAFYKARGDAALNKAQALRQAQLAFIDGDIRRTKSQAWNHPYYWAPFVLMGNWR